MNYSEMSTEQLRALAAEKASLVASLDTKQKTKKVCLNALYGSLGNVGFRYFYADQAESITMSGQLAIKWCARKINEELNGRFGTTNRDYILASDTDSVFVDCSKLVEKILESHPDLPKDKIIDILDRYVSTRLTQLLTESFEELREYMNAYEQRINFKRESIIEKGLFTAKKRYIFLVNDEEGTRFHEPKLKVKGIEIVRSDTPIFCREKLKAASKIILTQDESSLKKYIEEVKDEFMTLPVAEISMPTGVKGVEEYVDRSTKYKKGTPIHVRASILYNNLIESENLTKLYDPIRSGDRILYTYMKMPNPLGENVIGFKEQWVPEFKLDDYVDKETQFEKTFMAPLNTILGAIDWNVSTKSTLDDFFS